MSRRLLLPALLVVSFVAACTGDAGGDRDPRSGDAGSGDAGSGAPATTSTRSGSEDPSCPDGIEPASREEEATVPADSAGAGRGAPAAAAARPAGPGVLDLGVLLPVTGELAHLAPAQRAGVELAVADVNAAGGVLGSPVTLSVADSGGPGDDLASGAAQRLLDSGVDVIVGTAGEGTTLDVIDQVTDAGVLLVSAHNNAPAFTDYEDGGRYFRTAPSDVLQGRVLAELIADDGAGRVTVLSRADAYGEPILDALEEAAARTGLRIEVVTYPPADLDAAALAADVVDDEPDAVVVIGLRETAEIVDALDEAGTGPRQLPTYGVSGNLGDRLGDVLDSPEVLACMRGLVSAAPAPPAFLRRLLDHDPELVDHAHAAESYDAVVITALAAELARTDDHAVVAAGMLRITRDGTVCETPRRCLELLRDPAARVAPDVDYDGVGGRYEFSGAGEPTEASFRLVQFDAEGRLVTIGARTGPTA